MLGWKPGLLRRWQLTVRRSNPSPRSHPHVTYSTDTQDMAAPTYGREKLLPRRCMYTVQYSMPVGIYKGMAKILYIFQFGSSLMVVL